MSILIYNSDYILLVAIPIDGTTLLVVNIIIPTLYSGKTGSCPLLGQERKWRYTGQYCPCRFYYPIFYYIISIDNLFIM